MDNNFYPFQNIAAEVSSSDFELYCLELLKGYATQENLKDFKIEHNKKISSHDGVYQIDIIASFTAMNVSHQIIVECKRYKRSVERKVVTDLLMKMQSIGVQKGIIISTAGYQSGAVDFAKEHKIALVSIIDREVYFITNSSSLPDPLMIKVQLAYRNKLPKHFGFLWDYDLKFPSIMIYPSSEMKETAKKEVIEEFADQLPRV